MTNNQDSGLPTTNSGGLNPSTHAESAIGNSVKAAERTAKPATSENGKSQSVCSLPKWLDTDPGILASMLKDILALMQQAKWFVYIMPVTASDGSRTALRITISPPKAHVIGIDGPLHEQVITMDGKPVTE